MTASSSVGRLLILTQGAVGKLDFITEEERDEFIHYYADHTEERLRQSLLVWRANRASPTDLAKAQELDKSRRGAV